MANGRVVKRKPFVLPEEEGYYWERYSNISDSYWVLWKTGSETTVVIGTAYNENEMRLAETKHALGVA